MNIDIQGMSNLKPATAAIDALEEMPPDQPIYAIGVDWMSGENHIPMLRRRTDWVHGPARTAVRRPGDAPVGGGGNDNGRIPGIDL
jgi:hypothetical protein